MDLKGNKSISNRIRQTVLLICIACFFPYCSPDPSLEILESFSIDFENGSDQRLLPGEKANVILRVFNNLNPSDEPMKVNFEVINGGGSLSENSTYTDENRKAITEWTVGGESFNNTLRASIYKLSGEYVTSRDLTVSCFIPDSWNKVSTEPDGKITAMATDTVYGITLMISGGAVYRQGDRYYAWEKLVDPILETPRTIEIDANGILYVSTWSGDVIKSTDHGSAWKKCTKPYPEDPYYIYMSVANDNYIWAGKFDFPTKFSKDGAITWHDAGGDLSTFLNGNTFRLKSGALVNHGTNGTSRNRLNISYDDGLTWISRETPGYSTVMYVNENDEIFIGTQEYGFTIYQTTDMGATFKRVHSVYPEWGTTMENNIFNKWNGFYYIIVPGFGILKSADLIHYENYWLNSDLNDLFIDHNGVLIAKNWDYKTVYYWKNSD